MGLKGDIDEVAKVWISSPWRIKVYLALSTLLASGSIASLSDVLFKWKGFVLDAVVFYRSRIGVPFHNLMQSAVDVRLPEGFSDHILLWILLLASLTRYQFFVCRDFRCRLEFIGVYGCMFSLYGWALAQDFIRGRGYPVSLSLLMYGFAIVFSFFTTTGAGRIVLLASLIAPLALVGVVAAVHAGLTRGAA
jgi:hypothetical protein